MSNEPNYSTYVEKTNSETGIKYWECDCLDADHVISIPDDERNRHYVELQEYIASE